MREHIHIWDWEHACSVAQLCPALCDPVDCSPPGSSVDGISQARILEWVATSIPRDLPDPESEPEFPDWQRILYH